MENPENVVSGESLEGSSKQEKAPFSYKKRTKKELFQIAKDLYEGKIFTDRHLEDVKDLHLIFLVLVFMSHEDLEELFKDLGLVFEYLSEAGPRSVNGYPNFFSMQYLNKEDARIVFEHYEKIRETMKNLESGVTNG